MPTIRPNRSLHRFQVKVFKRNAWQDNLLAPDLSRLGTHLDVLRVRGQHNIGQFDGQSYPWNLASLATTLAPKYGSPPRAQGTL